MEFKVPILQWKFHLQLKEQRNLNGALASASLSEINMKFLLLCSFPTVGGFFIDSPYCQPLSIAPFIIHLGPQDFFSDF